MLKAIKLIRLHLRTYDRSVKNLSESSRFVILNNKTRDEHCIFQYDADLKTVKSFNNDIEFP